MIRRPPRSTQSRSSASSDVYKRQTVPAANQPSTSSSSTGAVSTAPAPGSREEFVAEVGDRVFFGFDKYDLSPEARTTLERQAFWLRKYPSATVTIEGHCDERGTREYNLALGERRARACLLYTSPSPRDRTRSRMPSSA
eukprot:TRINITY_DN496_c0_g1_i20.p1 TRINITY_DN496_c0_g1~~TRINITY_DN496_c0_g1_i20.p1  ORF type:complete len:140 (+),score=57.63 TRINITY_DN496_c0_g1_i20:116-535(+)